MSQKRALRWLGSNMGLKSEELKVGNGAEAPTFRTKDGRGFHVKKLFAKTAVFYESEKRMLADNFDKTCLLLVSDKGDVKQVPARVLLEDDKKYEDYTFKWVERRYDYADTYHREDGTVVPEYRGVIPLKLSRRNETSRHYRVNHVPVESFLVWKHGEYEMKQSVGDNGRMDFWILFRPQVALT